MFEKKMASIRAYESQFPPEKQDIFERVRAMNRHWGSSAGFEYGERLASPKTLGVTNLMLSLHL